MDRWTGPAAQGLALLLEIRRATSVQAEASERARDLRVSVIDEEARACLQLGDSSDVPVAELEVEHVEVLSHTLRPHGLGDDDDLPLDEPTQDDLRDRLPVLTRDGAEDWVGEEVVLALVKRSPRLDLHPPLAHEVLFDLPLVEGVRLDLVDGRNDLVVLDQVYEAVRVEVGDADRPDAPLAVERLHGAPGAVVVPEGLVDEVQVEVVDAESLQGGLECAASALLAGVLDPELGRDEKIFARDAAGADRATDRLFVLVGGCRVDVAVACGERVRNRLLSGFRGDLVDAESEGGHLDTVVERDYVHG